MAETNLLEFLDSEINNIQNNRISGFQSQIYKKLIQLQSDDKTFGKNDDINLMLQAQVAESLSKALIETVNIKLVDYATGGTIDLSNYYTSTQVDNLISSRMSSDIQGDWNETDTSAPSYIQNKPIAVSAFTNDAGYLTKHQSLTDYAKTTYVNSEIAKLKIEDYATKEYVDTLMGNIDLTGYATEDYVKAEIERIDPSKFDLAGYAKLEDVSKAISESGHITQEDLDRLGFLTSIPDNYITEEILNQKGYLTEHQSLENYVTNEQLSLVLVGYLTSIPDEYITNTELEEKGYLTEHQSLADYVTRNYVNDMNDTLTSNITKLANTINGLMFVGTYEEYQKAMEEATINEETFTVITKEERTGYDNLENKDASYAYVNFSGTPVDHESKWGYNVLLKDSQFGPVYGEAYRRFYNALRHNGKDTYAMLYKLNGEITTFPTKSIFSTGPSDATINHNGLMVYLKDLNLKEDEVKKVIACVRLDNPELVWKWGYDTNDFNYFLVTDVNESGQQVISACNIPNYPEEERLLKLAQMDRTFVKICNTIEKAYGIIYIPDTFKNNAVRYNLSEKQKIVKAIHDYLIVTNRYGDTSNESAFKGNQIAWSALSEGECDPVCLGYAQAFQYCCWKWGILAITVMGYTGSGNITHAWNTVSYEHYLVKDFVDGSTWADIDVTWDDPVAIDESTKEVLIDGYKDYCSWQYFNKTTQEIEENHIRRCFDDGYSSAYPLYPDDATCSTLSYDYSNNFEDKGILFGGY